MVTGDKWADYSKEDYGFCHFYQDESWETINIADDEAWYPEDLVEDAWNNASIQLNQEKRRSTIAWQVALCSWPNGAGSDNWPRGKKYKMPSLDARKNQRDRASADEKPRKESTSHWYRRMCFPRADSDYEELDSLLIEALNDFPRDATGDFEVSFNPEYPKSIRPFDRLGIEAYWDDSELEYEIDEPDFDGDVDDEIDDWISWPIPKINIVTRGDLHQREYGTWRDRRIVCYLSDSLKNAKQKVAYLYLAPFMLVTATKACLSKSYKNEVNLTLHLELIPFDLDELLASVHETAKRPYDDRGRLFAPERRA